MSPQSVICGPGNDKKDSENRILRNLHFNHPFTLSAAIELTHKCNLTCPHCYIAPNSCLNEMSTLEIVDVLDQLAKMGVLLLTLTGGEPSVRTDFFEIIQSSVAKRFVVTLKTNGALFTTTEVQRLAHLGVYEFNASLYHTDRSMHDNFVGQSGAWSKTVAALRTFKEAGGRSRVSAMAMNWNVDNIPMLEDFCASENWKIIMDFRIESRADGDKQPRCHHASSERLVELVQRSEFFRRSAIERITEMPTNEMILCGIEKGLVVQPNGDVVPCVSLPEFRLGNIREQRIVDIWNQSMEYRKTLSIRWGEHGPCNSCDLATDCTRCPASAYREHGDMKSPSTLDCQLAKVWHQARLNIEKDGK